MSIRNLGKRLASIPEQSVLQKTKLPLEGGNEGAFRLIENAEYKVDGINTVIKQRGGTLWLKNFFGKIVKTYGFIDPLGSGHKYMIVQGVSGKIYLYNITTDDSNEIDDVDTSEPLFFELVGAFLYYFSDDGKIQRYYNLRLDQSYDYGAQYAIMPNSATPKVLKGDKAVSGTRAHATQVIDALGNSSGTIDFVMGAGGFGNEAFVNYDPAVQTTKETLCHHIVDTLNGNSDFEFTAEFVSEDTFMLRSARLTSSEDDWSVSITTSTNLSFTTNTLTGASFIDVGIPDADISFDYEKTLPLSVKAYSLIEIYDDGSVSALSHPVLVLNEWYQDRYDDNDFVIETVVSWVDRVKIEYPDTLQDNVAKRYLLATPWIQANDDINLTPPPYPTDTIEGQYNWYLEDYAEISDILTPSSPDYPIGMWYVVKEVGVSAGFYVDSAKDSEIALKPVASLGYETSAGISDNLIRGQIEPRSVSSIKGALIIGGYDQNRLELETVSNPLPAGELGHYFQKARAEVYKGYGFQDGFPEWVNGFQLEYSDGLFSNVFAHTKLDDNSDINTLNKWNKHTLSGFNNQVSGISSVACRLDGEKWRFGGFQLESTEPATWNGTLQNDNDGMGDYATIRVKIDSDTWQDIKLYGIGTISKVSDVIGVLMFNMRELGYDFVARVTTVGDWYFQSSNPNTVEQYFEIDVQETASDYFFNIEVTPSQTVTYPGTTITKINKDFRLMRSHRIDDAEMHGKPVIVEFDSESDVENLQELDFANQRIGNKLNLSNYIMTCVPAQSQNLNRQTRIVDQSEIIGVAPIDLDVQDAIRYQLLVWTKSNTQKGFLIDAGSGSDVYFSGEFEIVHYGETLKGRDSFNRYREGVVYQTVNSVYLFTTSGGMRELMPNDRYPETQRNMIAGAFDGEDGNIWLLFDDSTRALLIKEKNQTVTFANYSNIPNVSLVHVSDIGGELYISTASGSNYALCKANVDGLVVDEYGDEEESVFRIVMETDHIATDAQRVKLVEIHIGGQKYNARIFIDLQKSRIYKSKKVWSREFAKDVSLPAKELRMYNTAWIVNKKGVMPRIRIEMNAEIEGFIDDIEVHYSVTSNENKATE